MSDTAEIGSTVNFEDDGPAITVDTVAAADLLEVDETDLSTDATANFSDNFSNTPDFGADGAGSIGSAYALSVSGSGADSGLDDVATGEDVLLSLNGSVVEGRTAIGDLLAFTVSVDGSGFVTLDQQRAVEHPDTADPDDAVTLAGADLIALTRTDIITDRDGDQASDPATIDIGQALSFRDDGPAITVDVVADPDAIVRADAGELALVFRNLLENAVKYSDDPVEIKVAVSNVVDGRVRIDISDRGIGIPVRELRKIFQRFYRVGRGWRAGRAGRRFRQGRGHQRVDVPRRHRRPPQALSRGNRMVALGSRRRR